MLLRHSIMHIFIFSSLALATVSCEFLKGVVIPILNITSVPFVTIWNFVDYRRYGAFPEEDHISLAYILGGNFMTRLLFMQHFKSILNYSDHFFRLHFIVDDENREDVNELMTSWNITNCEWFFHNLTNFEGRVKWIPNSHYSKYYGLSKLLIPEIIGDNVAKIMFVDIDIVFHTDIFYLWQKFREFTKCQSIGMAENLSDWYLNKDGKKTVWPALGRGFNTGIIMMDLDKLRERDWKSKWRIVANKYLKIHGKTTMSDQDIFNAFVYDHPCEIKTLPCEYNFQLGSLTKSDELCDEPPLALHFNSQNKTVRKNYMMYNEIRKEIDGIDGSDLRRRRGALQRNTTENHRENVKGRCKGRMTKPAELCLVTQFSVERLDSFLKSAKVWNYPISAAVYGNDKDLMDIARAVKSLDRMDITLHMVFEELEPTQIAYPINFLRNVAINYSNCEHLLLVDVDFTVFGDHNSLLAQTKALKGYELLVVPAFELVKPQIHLESEVFPTTKRGVVKGLKNGDIQMFRGNIWPSAHNATNATKWAATRTIYNVEYGKNYEPYFVIRKDKCPLYDQRFGGFGWNKVTHVMQLWMMNYKFMVSPSSYMFHQRHNVSEALLRWRRDPHYQSCLHSLRNQFVQEISRKLKNEFK